MQDGSAHAQTLAHPFFARQTFAWKLKGHFDQWFRNQTIAFVLVSPWALPAGSFWRTFEFDVAVVVATTSLNSTRSRMQFTNASPWTVASVIAFSGCGRREVFTVSAQSKLPWKSQGGCLETPQR